VHGEVPFFLLRLFAASNSFLVGAYRSTRFSSVIQSPLPPQSPRWLSDSTLNHPSTERLSSFTRSPGLICGSNKLPTRHPSRCCREETRRLLSPESLSFTRA